MTETLSVCINVINEITSLILLFTPSYPCSRVQEPQVCLSRQPLHTITQQLDIGKVESCLKYSELTHLIIDCSLNLLKATLVSIAVSYS